MADTAGGGSSFGRRMCSIPEKFQLHLAMLTLQFGYAGFHVVSRAALNMGISKIVFPVYRNILAFLLLLPFAYFLEKKERPPITWNFIVQFFLLAVVGITANQGFYLLGLDNTSPTFASAIQNSVPAITFLMAVVLSWCEEYGKTYTSEQEREERLKVFEENYEIVNQHNAKANSSYTLALNAFADLTNNEFKTKYLGLSPSDNDLIIRLKSERVSIDETNLVRESDVPDSLDWRKKGAVTGVKDQGSCGACWSFSATGAVEGINQIVTGSLISLSEQELIDCDKSYNDGCGGGLMEYAYQFIIKNKGIDTEEDYPYKGRDGKCNKDKLKRHTVTIDSYADLPSGNEKKLKQAVATQPISVGICGSDSSFQLYSGGIFTGPCSTALDHAVLIVGYDSQDGKDYWIIKNSWGRYWGMNGYMHMQRNTGNAEGVCGINMLASYPIKTSPNPPPSPSPDPVRCNMFTYCSSGETCCCGWRFLGLCLSWKCCGAESAVCCKDHVHCCPHDYPICDTTQNICLKKTGNSTLVKPLGKKSFSVA